VSEDQQPRQAPAWQLVSEIVLRHPEHLVVLHSHPTGIYDCLRVIKLDGSGYFDVNQLSSGSAWRSFAADTDDQLWEAMLDEWIKTKSREDLTRRIERWFGLAASGQKPAPTPWALSYAVLARFLSAPGTGGDGWMAHAVVTMDDLDSAHIDPLLVDQDEGSLEGWKKPSEIPDSAWANSWVLVDGMRMASLRMDLAAVTIGDAVLDLMSVYEVEHDLDAVADALCHHVAPRMASSTDVPKAHHWIMPATARLTQAEAEEFADIKGESETSLGLIPGEVRCARCDEVPDTASDVCPGFASGSPFPHRWAGLLKLSLDDDEALVWATEAEFPYMLSPQGVGLICTLCGSEWSQAQPECPEQRFFFSLDSPTP